MPAMSVDSSRGGPALRPAAARALKANWTEYCNSASIDGVRYFVEEDRSRFERVFWVLALTLSLVGCSLEIHKLFTKWSDTPVLVSFAERATPIRDVPFPAITICPEVKFRRSEFNFTDVFYKYEDYMTAIRSNGNTSLTNITDKELRYLEAVSGNICIDASLDNDTIPLERLDTLRKLAPPMDEVFWECEWNYESFDNCSLDDGSPLFSTFLTDEGLCYTFNMLSHQELFTPITVQHNETGSGRPSQGWSLESGYPKNASQDTYPERSLGQGPWTGLHFRLRANKSDYDYLCRSAVEGFKIMVHSPADIPHGGREFFRVQLNHDVRTVVKPSMMTTSEGLRDYDPSDRQCYFPSERHLLYFKIYTQKNCELECLANTTYRMCGCTAFHMPRSREIPVCGSGSSNCYFNAAESLLRRESPRDPDRSRGNGKKGRGGVEDDDCNCLPACTSLEYDVELSDIGFDWDRQLEAWRMPAGSIGEGVGLASVAIYFKQAQFITSRRSELYGPTEFLADVGGVLGLFSGFSLISLIEIVYFLSVRLWCNVRRSRRQREHAKARPPVGDEASDVEENHLSPAAKSNGHSSQ